MNRGSSPNGFSGLSSLRTAVQTRRRMSEREFHNSSFPHTKGRRRGSCVVPSASITSKSHDNTINPHFPSLYSWLPPCAVPLAGTCRPVDFHLSPRRLPFAAPPAGTCRPAGCHLPPCRLPFAAPPAPMCRPAGSHLPPHRLPSAAPRASICRPAGCHLAAAISSQSQQDESLISQS